MEIEKRTNTNRGSMEEMVEKEEEELQHSMKIRKRQYRRGGIRTLPFILGEPPRHIIILLISHIIYIYIHTFVKLAWWLLTSADSFPSESFSHHSHIYIYILPLLIHLIPACFSWALCTWMKSIFIALVNEYVFVLREILILFSTHNLYFELYFIYIGCDIYLILYIICIFHSLF